MADAEPGSSIKDPETRNIMLEALTLARNQLLVDFDERIIERKGRFHTLAAGLMAETLRAEGVDTPNVKEALKQVDESRPKKSRAFEALVVKIEAQILEALRDTLRETDFPT